MRETALDGYFPKGTAQGTNPATSGGNATHTHTSPAHTHIATSHTHTITVGNQSDLYERAGTDSWGQHNHGTVTSSSSTGGALSSVTSSYDSFSNNPPYNEVIYIKPSANVSALPNNVVALSDDTSFANNTGKWKGFYHCDGQNSTTDLRDKYIKGAVASQEVGASAGSYTNVHTLVHSHTVATHNHANVNTTASSEVTATDSWGGARGGHVTSAHVHAVTLNDISDTISATNPSITTTETVEPAYTKLVAVQNKSGVSSIATGIIGMWLGALSAIPRGWVLCNGSNGTVDMRSRHLKIANIVSDAGVTGGSNAHTHSNNTHSHTSSGHQHTGTTNDHTAFMIETTSRGLVYQPSVVSTFATVVHPVSTTTTTPTYSTETTSADSANNEPSYVTVAFIKLVTNSGGGSLLAGVL